MIPSSRGRAKTATETSASEVNRPPLRRHADAGDELERFKRQVNLTELAASLGYKLVHREQRRTSTGKVRWRGSTAASIMMRHPGTDDKIIVGRGADGHWTYFSVRRDDDNGTVVDFLQNRGVRGLGAVRKQLRAWLHEDRPVVPVQLYRSEVKPHVKDPVAVAAAYASARIDRSRYLSERGIDVGVERDPRFAASYRVDGRGNVIFPHTDRATGRVIGFEIKNNSFTGFATGGQKTYWMSAARADDDRLVIVESAIDAFSYHQIFPHPHTRYLSTGGGVSPEALRLIGRAIREMPAGADLVSATDADDGGEKLHAQLIVAGGRELRRHVSPVPKDWNDYLRKLNRELRPKRENRLER